MKRYADSRLLALVFVLCGIFSLWASVAEAQLDGVWRRGDGQTIEISGSTGVFRAFSSAWQKYVDAGMVSLGDVAFRNISQRASNQWNYDHLWGHHRNEVPTHMSWSVEGTLTLSADGRTLTAWTRTEGGGTDTFTFRREETSTTDWDVRVGHHLGTISKQRPVFGWRYRDWAPTWTEVWINRDGQTYWTPWIQHSSATVGQELRWTPSRNLPPGRYTFWMRGWRADHGYGVWSEAGTFTIALPVPAKITLVSPSGVRTGDSQTYTWQKDARATWYELYIMRRGGQTPFRRWYEMSGTGQATVTLRGHAAGAEYAWFVRGWSPGGTGPWSDQMSFSIDSGAPAAPVLTQPTGNITVARPQFRWNQAARAEHYRLYVTRGGTAVIDQWVQSTSFTPSSNLSAGTYRWWVASWNAATRREVWSSSQTFSISDPGPDPDFPNQMEIDIANLARNHAQQGRAQMVWDPILARFARDKALDMANRRYFSHTDPDGLHPNRALHNRGYRLPSFWDLDANYVESIHAGSTTAQGAFTSWLNSPGHRRHLLAEIDFYKEQTRYGVGYARVPGSPYVNYFVFVTAPPSQ